MSGGECHIRITGVRGYKGGGGSKLVKEAAAARVLEVLWTTRPSGVAASTPSRPSTPEAPVVHAKLCAFEGSSYIHCVLRSSNMTTKHTHAGNARLFKCPMCPYRFAQSSHVTVHIRTHTGERPFKCSHCPKRFSRSDTLHVHTRTHTGEKPYKCSVCPRRFTRNGDVTVHQRTHTGEKPYKCSQCSKCFAQSSHVRAHERAHTGEKPFECPRCHTRFSRLHGLVSHQRVVHDRIQCSVGPKRFTHPGTRRAHGHGEVIVIPAHSPPAPHTPRRKSPGRKTTPTVATPSVRSTAGPRRYRAPYFRAQSATKRSAV